jgi:CHAT domain-containing protein/tetratricopeptide (TPR) repeat protein
MDTPVGKLFRAERLILTSGDYAEAVAQVGEFAMRGVAVGWLVLVGMTSAAETPIYERLLQGADAKRAADLLDQIETAEQNDRYDTSIQATEALLALRRRVQGEQHYETRTEVVELAVRRTIAALPADQRAAWRKSQEQNVQGWQLFQKGKFAAAQPLWQTHYQNCRQVLGADHAFTALAGNNLAACHKALGQLATAEQLHRQALAIRQKVWGDLHPDTASSYTNLASVLTAQGQYPEAEKLYRLALQLCVQLHGERHAETALAYNNLGFNLNAQAQFVQAEPPLRQALEQLRHLHGANHADTARAGNNLASSLQGQGKYADAEVLLREALAVRQKVVGEQHPLTATGYNNLAGVVELQGKLADAEALFRQALEVLRQTVGVNHPEAARCANNLATNLQKQGRFAEAELLYQQAIQVRLTAEVPDPPELAQTYGNYAALLLRLGKFSAAETYFSRSLELNRRRLGHAHSATALSLYNLGMLYQSQYRHQEAFPFLQLAETTYHQAAGASHPDTLRARMMLAVNLDQRKDYAAAEPLHRQTLATRRQVLGELHPDVARSCYYLAQHCALRENTTESDRLFHEALELMRSLLGELNPDVVAMQDWRAQQLRTRRQWAEAETQARRVLLNAEQVFSPTHPHLTIARQNLAECLHAQGKWTEAQSLLEQAARSFESGRLVRSDQSLERIGEHPAPYLQLATLHARAQRPRAAWAALEANLARAVLDEAAARRAQPTTTPNRWLTLQARVAELHARSLALAVQPTRTPHQNQQLQEWLTKQTQATHELTEMAVQASQAEQIDWERLQAQLPADTAVVAWVDLSQPGIEEHWVCLLRRGHEPLWAPLPGTGPAQKWTPADNDGPANLRRALVNGRSGAELSALIARCTTQRLGPILPHLTDIQRLIVMPTGAMVAVPVEVLAERFTIAYAPSATLWAKALPAAPLPPLRLLALGDPIFAAPLTPLASLAELPPNGLLVQTVVPDGAAEHAQIRPNDVLLKYAGVSIDNANQLRTLIQEQAQAKTVALEIWRDGQTLTRSIAGGKLGLTTDTTPAPIALKLQRANQRLTAKLTRGDTWAELPGTTVEVARLRQLFGDRSVTLTRSDASEQALEQLRAAGELARFRYVHLATHGQANFVHAFESALILAQDRLPVPAAANAPYALTGQLTARKVLDHWRLNADLVTLSACESALGQATSGEGFLGFTQAFLLAGSRSVCVSLWKVDDAATALLMGRFYENLLGQRPGLTAPLGKAAALAEAKAWLRNLNATDAATHTAALARQVTRGKEPAAPLVVPSSQEPLHRDKPFAHPRYWAAFVLIGAAE